MKHFSTMIALHLHDSWTSHCIIIVYLSTLSLIRYLLWHYKNKSHQQMLINNYHEWFVLLSIYDIHFFKWYKNVIEDSIVSLQRWMTPAVLVIPTWLSSVRSLSPTSLACGIHQYDFITARTHSGLFVCKWANPQLSSRL